MALVLSLALSLFCLGLTEAANAGGYFCEGCATVMEHAFLEVEEVVQQLSMRAPAGEEHQVQFDVQGEILAGLCQKRNFKDYKADILDACNQLVSTNAHILSHELGKVQSHTSWHNLYDMVNTTCRAQLDLCDGAPFNPPTRKKKRAFKCELCLAVASDIQNVLARKKGSKTYLSKQHIEAVIDSHCNTVVFRFPGRFGSRMQDMCDRIVSDFEGQLPELLRGDQRTLGKSVCGKEGFGYCLKRKGKWDGLSSPWSQNQHSSAHHQEL